ncbi:Predicted nucleic acid-binding protein, contains PIN domain [Pedobacter caeni]|uniref:Predicted nucleic acid-binding protein, contains PIN domain n=2 Tax=Pedobacter caeni TaxID=288992 RepID=A0A1M5DDI1_9SPHI|nr:Predicted nucleic acid-binding protein, contains PIN domain [Pedobacter caeni]
MSLTGSRGYSIIITDTSCFITLDKIDAFEILHQAFTNIVTTPEIQQEFGSELPKWIEIRSVQDTTLKDVFKETVDPGEASAIALALETSNAILIIDDLKGRKLASKMALNFMGTFGLLVKAKEFGIIAAVKPYIEKIQATNFRVSSALVDLVLERTGEK